MLELLSIVLLICSLVLLILVIYTTVKIRRVIGKRRSSRDLFKNLEKQYRIFKYVHQHAPALKLYTKFVRIVLLRLGLLVSLILTGITMLWPSTSVSTVFSESNNNRMWLLLLLMLVIAWIYVFETMKYYRTWMTFLQGRGEIIVPKAWHLANTFKLDRYRQLVKLSQQLVLEVSLMFFVELSFYACLVLMSVYFIY